MTRREDGSASLLVVVHLTVLLVVGVALGAVGALYVAERRAQSAADLAALAGAGALVDGRDACAAAAEVAGANGARVAVCTPAVARCWSGWTWTGRPGPGDGRCCPPRPAPDPADGRSGLLDRPSGTRDPGAATRQAPPPGRRPRPGPAPWTAIGRRSPGRPPRLPPRRRPRWRWRARSSRSCPTRGGARSAAEYALSTAGARATPLDEQPRRCRADHRSRPAGRRRPTKGEAETAMRSVQAKRAGRRRVSNPVTAEPTPIAAYTTFIERVGAEPDPSGPRTRHRNTETSPTPDIASRRNARCRLSRRPRPWSWAS